MSISAVVAMTLLAQPAELPRASVADLSRQYWHVELQWRLAGNHACSLPDFPKYEDEASPFRRKDQRVQPVIDLIKAIDKDALDAGRAGGIFPPQNMICDRPDEAREAFAEAERQLAELEKLAGLVPTGGH